MQKAQSSVEYIILLALLMLALSAIASVSVQRSVEISRSRLDMETLSLLNRVAGRVNTAVLEGNGFAINVTLPPDILGYDYSISIHSNDIVITLNNSTYSRSVATSEISGTFAKGSVNLIRNERGRIIITHW